MRLVIVTSAAIPLLSFATGCHGCRDDEDKSKPGMGPQVIELAVTVDDIPVRIATGRPEPVQQEEDVIKAFLAAFTKHGVPSVYGFVNGQRIDEVASRFPLLEEWRAAGHPLGNHTHSHPKLGKVADFLTDIDRGEDVLRRVYGSADERIWKVFRFPYLNEGAGEKRKQIREHLDRRGYRVAPVSVDFFDYAYADAYTRCLEHNDASSLAKLEGEVVDQAVSCTRGSAQATSESAGRPVRQVLLLHVGLLQAKVLDRLLGELKKTAKVRYVTLDQALEDPYLREHQRPDEISRRACGRASLGEVKKLCSTTTGADQPEERVND